MPAYTSEEIQARIPEILSHIDAEFPFPNQRRGQKLLILRIVKTYMEGKKYFILESPTGTGKSVISYTAMRVIEKMFRPPDKMMKSVILTKTKGLQTQYEKSFADVPTLWSANGYECNRDPYDEDAYFGSYACDKKLCRLYSECDYNNAKNKFMAAEMGVLNYAFFLQLSTYTASLVTLDECHALEHILCDHLSVKFNYDIIEKSLTELINCDLATVSQKAAILKQLDKIINIEEVTGWFENMRSLLTPMHGPLMVITNAFEEKKKAIDENKIDIPQSRKKTMYFYGMILRALHLKIAKLKFSKVEWIISERNDDVTIEFKPVSLAEEAGSLFKRGEFFIMMSATICGIPAFAASLGLTADMYNSESLDSVVPVENRQVISLGLPSFSIKTKDTIFPKYIEMIDTLIDSMGSDGEQHRGIIHTVTYENADYIIANSKHKYRMFIPSPEQILDIKKVMASKPDYIAVSPAITEGSDLEGDLCRFQIVLKVPFPYLGDAWIKRKRDISNDWYTRETINTLVQSLGRGVRSETDWCYSFILDGNFDRLVGRTDLFPKWFHKAIRSS